MTRLLAIVAVCVWLAGVPGTVQQRDPQATRQTAGTVRGRVIAADSGRPVAHATITVARADLPPGRASATAGNMVIADEQGGFSFPDLPNGAYELTASKPGTFLDTQYGQIDVDLPGTTVIVHGGQETTLELRLMRAGVIAGRVLDVNGEPIALADVALVGRDTNRGSPGALRSLNTQVTGQRTTRVVRTSPASASQTQSNDLGEFRFFGLPPDDYILSATPPPVGREARRVAMSYYPGASDPSQAARIQLGPGQQITGADFSIRSVPTVTISGIVLGPDGSPIPSGTLSLFAAGLEDVMSVAQVGGVTNGAFSFDAAPGTYVLRASQPSSKEGSAHDLSGSTPLAVGEQGLQGVTLTLGYGATVKGRVVIQGSSTSAPAQIRVLVESVGPGEVRTAVLDQTPASRSVSFGATSEGSDFAITGIESGRRRIVAQGPSELILKGVFVAGEDVTDEPISIAEAATISDVSVVFVRAKAVLAATVSSAPAEGGAVIVFPERPDWWTKSSRVKVAPIGTAPVTFDSLPAGPYLVVALSGVSARSVRPTPRLLTALALNAARVELVEGQTTPVNVQAMQLR